MVELTTLATYLHGLLSVDRFQDYAPNGLQVQGRNAVSCLVTGVTACQALLERAVALRADAVLVHHGYFWRGEDPCIVGMKQRRLRYLLNHDVSLLAYHLPLDYHPIYGNNAALARVLGIEVTGPLSTGTLPLGLRGVLATSLAAEEFAAHCAGRLGRPPQLVVSGDHRITTVGWCTGAAQDYINHAVQQQLDAFLSGEISERTFHAAREQGIHYIAAGHHATERYGVQALGDHLAEHFAIQHHFVDVDNPV